MLYKDVALFLSSNQALFSRFGVAIIFVAAALESLPIIGFFIPGQTIILFGGFFASLGLLSIPHIIIAAAVGCFLGDILGFFFGQKHSAYFQSKINRFVSTTRIERISFLLREHPAQTIIIGRFNSLTRSIAPFLSGISHTDKKRFFLYTFIAAVSWSFCFAIIGFVFGNTFSILAPVIGRFILIATIISILIICLAKYAEKRGLKLSVKEISLLIISVISLYAFSAIAQSVVDNGAFPIIDQYVAGLLTAWQNPFILYSIWIFGLITPLTFFYIALIPLTLLILHRRKKDAVFFALTLAAAGASVFLIKIAVNRPRPLFSRFFRAVGPSFPSGHAALALVFCALLAYILHRHVRKHFFVLLCALMGFIIILVSFSRLYFGLHWTSDVFGGLALGTFIFSFCFFLKDSLSQIYRAQIYKKFKHN